MENPLFKQAAEIERLESALERETIPKAELVSIAQRLDSLAGAINSDMLKSRYQTLCGRVHWKAVDGEIDEIFDAVIAGVSDEETKNGLISRIEQIRANHALSIESRQIITAAERCLQPDNRTKLPTEGKLAISEHEAGELAEHMYAIAELVDSGKLQPAHALYIALAPLIKERLDCHIDILGGSFDKLQTTDSLEECHAHSISVIRALVGFSSELTGNSDSYPAVQEVKELFNTSPKR